MKMLLHQFHSKLQDNGWLQVWILITYLLVSIKVGWRWVPYFLLSAKVQVMELSVSGRLKLADVLGGGRLVNLLAVLLGILCPIFIFWWFLCKSNFILYKGPYIFCSIKYIWLDCENKCRVNLWFRDQHVLVLNTCLGMTKSRNRLRSFSGL